MTSSTDPTASWKEIREWILENKIGTQYKKRWNEFFDALETEVADPTGMGIFETADVLALAKHNRPPAVAEKFGQYITAYYSQSPKQGPTVDISTALASLELGVGRDAKDPNSLEGFPVDGLHSERTETVHALSKALHDFKFILVRGTPFSGKTSLAYLLDSHLRQNANIRVMYLTMLEARPGEKWEDVWLRKFKESWEQTLTSSETKSTYIILDEGQETYNLTNHGELWRLIKKESDTPTLKLAIIVFAAYGSSHLGTSLSTPFQFAHIMMAFKTEDLPSLHLTKKELQEIYDNFTKLVKWELDAAICGYITWITCGHAGLVRQILLHIKKEFSKDTPPGQIYMHLHSASFGDVLSNVRGLPTQSLIESIETMKVCDTVIAGLSVKDVPDVPNGLQIAKDLVKAGYLMQTLSSFSFSSPLFERAYLMLRHKSYSPETLQEISLVDFIKAVLVKMNNEHLLLVHKTHANNKKMLEAVWQEEFSFAARALLPAGYVVVPNSSGKQQDVSDGYPDYYINTGVNWMVEILREGLNMKEHARRFEPKGRYSSFLQDIKEWLLIDFRTKKKKVRANYANMYHVQYSDDFSRFILIHPNTRKEELVVPVGGKLKRFEHQISAPGNTPKK